ncbi:hypothetical protein ACFE04_012863 [Oxalis oulophora]
MRHHHPNHHHRQHHLSPSSTPISSYEYRQPIKRRGSYSCGRCGLPKKGHVCHLPPTPGETCVSSSRQPQSSQLRRALSFDDFDYRCDSPFPEEEEEEEIDESEVDLMDNGPPASCLWEVFRRLSPAELLSAASVSKRWRDMTRRLWRAAEELRLRVPKKAQIGFVNSVLQKCPELVRLNLRMESDVDATILACIAFTCPNLEMIEINISEGAVNRITGDDLGRFVADKRCLTSLKMEGCTNLGGFTLSSSSLSTLWLSDLHSLSKMVFNCPSMKEISLEFSQLENDSTDLVSMVDCLGRNCPRLQNIHIASIQLSHAVVLSLTDANFRGLRMLSLVLGSEITDASVAAIASCYSKLELLDLSGSSISDTAIGMICNVFSDTMSRLLLALCPNITSSNSNLYNLFIQKRMPNCLSVGSSLYHSSVFLLILFKCPGGIQFATAQLPLLEIMDCGMTICDPNTPSHQNNNSDFPETFNNNLHLICQKLIIKHNCLKKLSLWGCSSLDALYLNCPQLKDLNLNSCVNLRSERLSLQCPVLEKVHASGCHGLLVDAIQSQVSDNNGALENQFSRKRSADGSKRVRVPPTLSNQLSYDDDKKRRRIERRQCNTGSSEGGHPRDFEVYKIALMFLGINFMRKSFQTHLKEKPSFLFGIHPNPMSNPPLSLVKS